ncbi:PLP-dependent aminotransferase family protein [Rhodobacteraceae bacterium 63075]|nr:PLP-dependent aminotransferase family protein [Rhodobacteraceae bacterium 63075]
MTNWLPRKEALSTPLHASLASQIARAIEAGELLEGDRLPPHRVLASSLGLSVHTVSKAYDSLRRQNLIDGKVGRGSFVLHPGKADDQPFDLEPNRRGGFDLSISRPVYSTLHVKRMQRVLKSLHKELDPATYLALRPNAGLPEHREAAKAWLSQCGLEADTGSIIITNGVSHGMSAALSALARQGDVVLTDMVTHHLTVSASAYFGLKLVGVAADSDGLLPDALEAACAQKRAKVLFLLANATNPKAYVMPAERRAELVRIARKHDLYIIENDAYGPIIENAPPPVSALAPERSVYLTTLSKCTVSGLRIGYMVAPPHVFPTLLGRHMAYGWMAPGLLAEIASTWVRDGTAMEMALWQREQMRVRHEILREGLGGFDVSGCETGLHVWLTLPDGWTSERFVRYAAKFNVTVAPEASFLTADAGPQNAVRLSKGSTFEVGDFEQAVTNIARLLERPDDPLPLASF